MFWWLVSNDFQDLLEPATFKIISAATAAERLVGVALHSTFTARVALWSEIRVHVRYLPAGCSTTADRR